MNQTGLLIAIHAGLFLLQIGTVAMAIMVKPELATLSVPISVAQAFFPNPFKEAAQSMIQSVAPADVKKP